MQIVFLLYAIVLFALTFYTDRHRADFLGLKLSPDQQKELRRFSLVFGVSTLLALAAALWPYRWLQLAALLLGALTAGVLGLRVAKYVGQA